MEYPIGPEQTLYRKPGSSDTLYIAEHSKEKNSGHLIQPNTEAQGSFHFSDNKLASLL